MGSWRKNADGTRRARTVLPFANMSGDPEQKYFAAGMVEEIITGLSRIRWLFVIRPHRTSPQGYALSRGVQYRISHDSPLEEAVRSEPVSGSRIPCFSGKIQGISPFTAPPPEHLRSKSL
jgi:hypothetical protein